MFQFNINRLAIKEDTIKSNYISEKDGKGWLSLSKLFKSFLVAFGVVPQTQSTTITDPMSVTLGTTPVQMTTNHVIVTAATANQDLILPKAKSGLDIAINNRVNTVSIDFVAQTGDSINGTASVTGTTAGVVARFYCAVDGVWTRFS